MLDARLAELAAADLVQGQTDSERVFALITASIRSRGGDVDAGLVDALQWLADNVPIYAVNLLLSTATDMWALRCPEAHELYLLDRRRADMAPDFDLRTSRIHAQSPHLDLAPSVVFASEPMDDDSAWHLIPSGWLVHVGEDLDVVHREVLPQPPKHQLSRDQLGVRASASQHASTR